MGSLKINLIFIAIMLTTVALISGCFFVPQFPTQTQDDVEEYEEALEDLENQLEDLTDELEETEVDEDEEVKVVVSQPVSNIDEDVQDLMDNNDKLTSMSYNYRAASAVDSETYEIYLKGDEMKILLPLKTQILNTLEIDTVIVDWGDRTATSYCQSLKYCVETGMIEEGVSFDEYYVMNPVFWLDEIDSAEKTEERKLFNRDATVADINDGEYVFWIEDFYGVPLQIEQDDEVIAMFVDAIFNRVDDSEMEFTVIE